MANRSYVLSVDSSSSSVEACLVDASSGVIVRSFSKPITLYTPREDWFEYDAEEIWRKQLTVMEQALRWAESRSDSILGIGIANQRETIVAWDKRTLKPICRAISWQDSRNKKFMKDFGWAQDLIRKKTGLYLSEYFSVSKMMWILENVECDRENIRFGTIDSWLILNLTKGVIHFTDITNASRTMCMNLSDEAWDKELLDLFNIPHNSLPQIRPSGSCFGFWRDIAILGVIGDQQAALLTLGNLEGAVQCTYGTGLFVLRNGGIHKNFIDGTLTTVAWKIGDSSTVYAEENGSFSCGRVLEQLKMKGLFDVYKTSTYHIPMSVYLEPVGKRLKLFDCWTDKSISINFDLRRQRGSIVLKSFLNGLILIVKGIVEDYFERCGFPIIEMQIGGQLATIDYLPHTQAVALGKKTFVSYGGNHSIMGVSFLVLLFLGKISWYDVTRFNRENRKNYLSSPLHIFETTGFNNLSTRLKYSL